MIEKILALAIGVLSAYNLILSIQKKELEIRELKLKLKKHKREG